jgi:hypothetical protein
MVGNAGPALWAAFGGSGQPAPGTLDPWTAAVVRPLAARFEMAAAFPFEGPPYHPFLRWAQRAEPVHPSPLGMLIHPEFGLWHAYRAALLSARRLALPALAPQPSPCASCRGRPCLSACPVGAFDGTGYDVAACRAYLATAPDGPCMTGGCLARQACPVGRSFAYGPAQAAYHMAAFAPGATKRRPALGRARVEQGGS